MVSRSATLVLFLCLLVHAQSTIPSTSAVPPSPIDASESAPPPASCPAGGPLGTVELSVRPPQSSQPALPFRTINHLTEGDTILYKPVLRPKERRPGEVAMVMVPQKRSATGDDLIVTDPKPADKAQEWLVEQPVSVAAFVYGPEGLSRKKVKGFLSQNDLLIAQLADYAEKTAETEGLIQTLADANSSAASVNSALSGFAAQYGVAAPIDRTAPPAVQAQTLFATMNPQLASYDPLTPSAGSRIGQTAGLTTVAATLFFGSPIGLAAGGTAMLLDLRAIAFPGIQFRSSFAQPVKNSLNLCGQRTMAPPHTRVAYIWANRIPNVPPPVLTIQHTNNIPTGQKTPIPAEASPNVWKFLERARDWSLEDDRGKKISVNVVKLQNQKSLEIDLAKAVLPPGDYRLKGFWDWSGFNVSGSIHVRPLSDFSDSRLLASSQDQLLAKGGKTVATVQGGDFEFTSKVEIKKSNDEFAAPLPVPFVLPRGLREGPQDRMDVQVDTSMLDPGEYKLLISQSDNKSHAVPMHLLQNPPVISNLPIIVNEGAGAQHYVLKGERLDLLTGLQSPAATIQLDSATKDGSQRGIVIQPKGELKADTEHLVTVLVKDRNEPLGFENALKITGPLPLIASSKLSLPAGLAVAVNSSEIPAGETLSAVLDVKNVQLKSALRVACAQEIGPQINLHIGEQTDRYSLQQLSPDQLFVSLDSTPFPAGCTLQAAIDNGATGRSAPYPIAQVVRFPQIDEFGPLNVQAADGRREFSLNGRNLETIQEVGWDEMTGFDVNGFPAPIPGQGQRQTLRVSLPDPPTPGSILYVWLRGEKRGRSTTVINPSSQTSGLSKQARIPVAVPASATPPLSTSGDQGSRSVQR